MAHPERHGFGRERERERQREIIARIRNAALGSSGCCNEASLSAVGAAAAALPSLNSAAGCMHKNSEFFGNSENRSEIPTTFVPKIVPKFAISFFLLLS
jgi:hypothetical protein